MHASQRVASSQCFHHSCRPLARGETLPQLPTLAEQLAAFQAEAERERAAAAQDPSPAEIQDEDDDDGF